MGEVRARRCEKLLLTHHQKSLSKLDVTTKRKAILEPYMSTRKSQAGRHKREQFKSA